MVVKVLRLGHSAHEVEVPVGATVEDALAKAGVPMQGHALSLDGLTCGPSTPLTEKSVVTSIPKVEGGAR